MTTHPIERETLTPHVPSVCFRGDELTAEKHTFAGTHRSIPPEETLRRIRPCFPRAGITRLANITGLDRIGIPVTLAVRPNGRTLSTNAGKGLTLENALVSGAMEALELHHAEVEWRPSAVRRSYRDIRTEYAVPPVEELPLAKSAPFPRDWPFLWTTGWDLLGQEEVALPVSMIHMGNRAERVHDLHAFQITSSGLASGNNLLEAVHAGLLEVVERDAATCHKERWSVQRVPPPVVDPASIPYASVRELLDRLDHAEIAVVVFDCTVDTGVPVYMADIFDRSHLVPGTFRGYGAHLDPEIALSRALTEAVQARTVSIAGSRDDLYRHRDVHRQTERDHRRMEALNSGGAPLSPAPLPSMGTTTFQGDVRLLMERVAAAGLRRIVVVDLSSPLYPVSVVKVVVPGMEGYRMQSYAPMERATRFARSLPERGAS
ncbi:methanogenesis marker 1 protein [Streptomyces lavendulae subsp. lavendulae]|uniref:YcaO-like family protein n=1 Tax=Streptomyces lavendulae TaxID=1914 RepID=UPI0024A127D4|nr:YcaO-like family protein [Streptomyces lavendulae]GLV88214.1 methanogenesis marker 1 protein [Streptomyces lavendulae subsp. lavendulae]